MVVQSDLTEEQADQIIETVKLEYPDAIVAKTKQKNGLWGRLAGNTCVNRDVQASWAKDGEAAFAYKILEQLTETDPHLLQRLLPERASDWREQLKAGVIKGT